MGDIDEDDPEGIDLADCATLLGQPRLLLWIRSKIGKFASPAATKNGRPIWHEDDVYRWAASTHPELIRRIPIRCWPDAECPATYNGAHEIEDAVVQTWKTDPGTVCVVWSRPELNGLSLPHVAAKLPDADALVDVQSTFNVFGPGLSTAQPDNLTEQNHSRMEWADLARVLGQPAPYWPLMLRIPTLIAAWKPGAPPVTYPTIPEVNTTPLLRLAATLPQNGPAHEILLHLARIAQHRSTTGALEELRTLAECEQRSINCGRHNGDVTAVAAHPLPIPKVDREAVSEQDRRGGWLQILARTDRLAAECVRQAKMWDGGRDFPFSNPEQINRTRNTARSGPRGWNRSNAPQHSSSSIPTGVARP
ncbi:MAG: hypothetical protein ACRDRY_04685 [Pseudonocardiaceae bacterium]